MNNALLDRLLADDEVCGALAWPIDFDVKAPTDDTDWFALTPAGELRPIAGDGTGGLFLLYGPQQKVLHFTSEGQAGVIAEDLVEAIGLMVAYPYWRDLLKFSGGGVLDEMRRAAPQLERELQADCREIAEVRALLTNRLALEPHGDRIAALHDAVRRSDSTVIVANRDGDPFDSLFNTFTVEDNPAWRRA